MPRARLSLIVVKEGSLPFSYQHILMGFVYAMISREDPSLAEMVHSAKSPKAFTFSWLWGGKPRVSERSLFYREGSKLRFIFSSWKEELTEAFANAVSNSEIIKLSGMEVFVNSIEVYREELSSEEKFILLSPLVLSVPVEKNGKLYHRFLSPEDGEFPKRFIENLKKRYTMFTDLKAEDAEFIPDSDYISRKRTSKLVDMKGTKIRGHLFPFTLRGDEKLIEFGYYAGFGERTAQGFGCAELVRR